MKKVCNRKWVNQSRKWSKSYLSLHLLSQQPNTDVTLFFEILFFVLPSIKWITVFAHSDFRKKVEKNSVCVLLESFQRAIVECCVIIIS